MIHPEEDAWSYEPTGLSLDDIAPVRAEVLEGDMRPLFLIWLYALDVSDPKKLKRSPVGRAPGA